MLTSVGSTKPRLTTGIEDLAAVVITRRRHPLEGRALPVLGRMRRHGQLELLLVLPDGSKSLIPSAWTDLEEPTNEETVHTPATLGSLADLLAVCVSVAELAGRRLEQGQAAGKSPCEEDSHAACPAQFDARSGSGAITEQTTVEVLPDNAIATAVALLAGVIAKTAARWGIEVATDE